MAVGDGYRVDDWPACIEKQLGRFDIQLREPVARCAMLSRRIAQLAHSHPLLLYALAIGYGPKAERIDAVRRAAAGRPLSEVCSAIGIPVCFRPLPPEAIPLRLTAVRWSTQANRRLAPWLPVEPASASSWLSAIHLGHHLGGEPFAIWLARQQELFAGSGPSASKIFALAAFAWCSRSDEMFSPASLKPWTANLGLREAIERACAWLRYVNLTCELGSDGLTDPWLTRRIAAGHEFIPLLTAQALIDEADAMRNCVADMSGQLARGECRLFAMLRDGARVATIEIRWETRADEPVIAQIKGPCNSSVPVDVLRSAYQWLEQHDVISRPNFGETLPLPETEWQSLMAPYLTAHPGAPRYATFAHLKSGLNSLRGRVRRRRPPRRR